MSADTIREELFDDDWDGYLGNDAYHLRDMTSQLFRGQGNRYSRDFDDVLSDIADALSNGEYGYPDPSHENLYEEYFRDEDWKEIARLVIDAHMDEEEFMDLLWEWNEYDLNVNEIASQAVWGSNPHWEVAYELGVHILDDVYDIFEVKGEDGVKGWYEQVIPVTPELKKAVKSIRFLQAYATENDMTDHIVSEIEDNRDAIVDLVMKLVGGDQ